MGNLGSIPGLGISPGEGKVYPLQCSGLENYMDCIVHGVTKSQTHKGTASVSVCVCVCVCVCASHSVVSDSL